MDDAAPPAAVRIRRRRPTLATERHATGTVITYDPPKPTVQVSKITSQAGTEERSYGRLGEVTKDVTIVEIVWG